MFIQLLPGIITTVAFLWLNVSSWSDSGSTTTRTEHGTNTSVHSSTEYKINWESVPIAMSWWAIYYATSFSKWFLYPTMLPVAGLAYFFLKN